jgi:HK97 family phage major capsid protein
MKTALRFAGVAALVLVACLMLHLAGDPHAMHVGMIAMATAASPADVTQLLNDVSKELGKVSDDLARQSEAAMAEIKNVGTLSNATKTTVDQLLVSQTALTGKVNSLQAQLTEVEQKAARRPGPASGEAQSVGQQLIANEGLKGFAVNLGGGRRFSAPVKNTTTSTGLVPTVAPAIVQPDQAPLVPRLRQRLFIRDLLTPGRTGSPAIFWVQQTGFTNAARVVSEGTAKPYSDITFTTKITPVATIAHMFKASKQILDDFAQLQSLVDSEMRYGLKYAEEQEILFGDGTGVHLHGLVPQATAYHHEFVPALITPIDDIRLAMLQSQLARIPASGIVLHFTDWARIELEKDTVGRYLLGDPKGNLGPSMWGLPVVTTEIASFVGKFLTGPFQGGAQIFDREDSNVVVSTENADDFEKNLISIRCEERAALATYRPEGFIYGSMTTAT